VSRPFRERNPVTIGLVSIVVLAALLVAALKVNDLPLIGGGTTYYADFTDASGLKSGDEVRIAGVRVGKVTGVSLDGDKVKVAFKIKTGSRFGDKTGAEVKIKTLLGQMFLALDPAGSGQLDKGAVIPTTRTKSAYDVVKAFSGLAQRAEAINLPQLRTALNTLAQATSTTPQSFQDALRGVSRLSNSLAKRDQQLSSLLTNLQSVSTTLGNRNEDIVRLMQNGDVLLRALVERRDAIHRLLVSTSTLSTQLTALVQQTRADLKPALDGLDSVVNLLLKNQNNLDESLRLMAPFYRVFANLLGNGPWFDTWIANLPPLPDLLGAAS
jgi:phospholipid/cholesterol/gamma-HCH transport system substrate-binding protein